jgi:Protein of unknown function (DUF3489)
MNAFTIDAGNNLTVHPTRKAARESGAGVFDTAENLAELIGPDHKRLVEIWNGLTGVTPVKKFASRAIAVRRIFAAAHKLGAPAPEVPLETQADTPVAPEARPTTKTSSAKKADAVTKAEAKPGSKKEILLGLISRNDGASLEELTAALHWQKHSVRGFIATLGKTMRIESFKTAQGVRAYKSMQAGSGKTC